MKTTAKLIAFSRLFTIKNPTHLAKLHANDEDFIKRLFHGGLVKGFGDLPEPLKEHHLNTFQGLTVRDAMDLVYELDLEINKNLSPQDAAEGFGLIDTSLEVVGRTVIFTPSKEMSLGIQNESGEPSPIPGDLLKATLLMLFLNDAKLCVSGDPVKIPHAYFGFYGKVSLSHADLEDVTFCYIENSTVSMTEAQGSVLIQDSFISTSKIVSDPTSVTSVLSSTINNGRITNVYLKKSKLDYSDVTRSKITNTNLDNVEIINSVLAKTRLSLTGKLIPSRSTFKDVSFKDVVLDKGLYHISDEVVGGCFLVLDNEVLVTSLNQLFTFTIGGPGIQMTVLSADGKGIYFLSQFGNRLTEEEFKNELKANNTSLSVIDVLINAHLRAKPKSITVELKKNISNHSVNNIKSVI